MQLKADPKYWTLMKEIGYFMVDPHGTILRTACIAVLEP